MNDDQPKTKKQKQEEEQQENNEMAVELDSTQLNRFSRQNAALGELICRATTSLVLPPTSYTERRREMQGQRQAKRASILGFFCS